MSSCLQRSYNEHITDPRFEQDVGAVWHRVVIGRHETVNILVDSGAYIYI